MCTKKLHVDIWPGVIGHGAFESGVYFENGGREALRFGFFFVAPQGAPAPGPWWGHSSGLLWLFSSPEGREKSPKTGARQRGHLRGPARPHVPGAGLEGAFVAQFWRPLEGARAGLCNSVHSWCKVCAGRCFGVLLRAARFPISDVPS